MAYIYGTTGYDYLNGTSGDDHIYRDTLQPYPNNDEIGNWFYASAGNDTLYGVEFVAQSMSDTIDYSGASGGVYINTHTGYAGKTALTTGTVTAATATIGQDVLYYFEDVIGSPFGDRIYGRTGHQYPGIDGHFYSDGGAGDDIIYGSDVDDFMLGGTGNDILVVSLADFDHVDNLTGGAGNDSFVIGATTSGFVIINDFTPADDILIFNHTAFGLTHGGGANLVIDGPATGSDHTFLYNSTTGYLAFDPDGAGPSGGFTLSLRLSPGLALTSADIHF